MGRFSKESVSSKRPIQIPAEALDELRRLESGDYSYRMEDLVNLVNAAALRFLPLSVEADGRLKGDLTVLNWGDGTFWIMGSYYLRAWHMRWFNQHMMDGVQVRDLGEEMAGFALTGPNSRKVIEKLCHQDVGALKFMGCGDFDVGLVRKIQITAVGLRFARKGGFQVFFRFGAFECCHGNLLEVKKGTLL